MSFVVLRRIYTLHPTVGKIVFQFSTWIMRLINIVKILNGFVNKKKKNWRRKTIQSKMCLKKADVFFAPKKILSCKIFSDKCIVTKVSLESIFKFSEPFNKWLKIIRKNSLCLLNLHYNFQLAFAGLDTKFEISMVEMWYKDRPEWQHLKLIWTLFFTDKF